MKLERSTTRAAKKYWERIDRTAQKADAWPAWKKTDWVAKEGTHFVTVPTASKQVS